MSNETYATNGADNTGTDTQQLLLESYLNLCKEKAAIEAKISAIQAMLVKSWSGTATASNCAHLDNDISSQSTDTLMALLEQKIQSLLQAHAAPTGQVDISRALEQVMTGTGAPDFMQALRRRTNIPTGRESQSQATVSPCRAKRNDQTRLPPGLQLIALQHMIRAKRNTTTSPVQAVQKNQGNDLGAGSNSNDSQSFSKVAFRQLLGASTPRSNTNTKTSYAPSRNRHQDTDTVIRVAQALLSDNPRTPGQSTQIPPAVAALLLGGGVGNQPLGTKCNPPFASAAAAAAAAASAVPICSEDTKPSPDVFPKDKNLKFPVLLHQMLTDLEEQGHGHIASFTPDGKGFVIHKPREFMRDVVSKRSQASSFASFQRQVNLYCFVRTKWGHKNIYSHPQFQRDQPQLCVGMTRTKIKGGRGPSFAQYLKSKNSTQERAESMQPEVGDVACSEEKQAASATSSTCSW